MDTAPLGYMFKIALFMRLLIDLEILERLSD